MVQKSEGGLIDRGLPHSPHAHPRTRARCTRAHTRMAHTRGTHTRKRAEFLGPNSLYREIVPTIDAVLAYRLPYRRPWSACLIRPAVRRSDFFD